MPGTTSRPDLVAFLEDLGRRTAAEDAPIRVRELLEAELEGGLDLPDPYLATEDGCYARHLLARFESGAQAIVMVWDEDQVTPLHDHGGLWCVEGVVRGIMEVTRFRVEEEDGDGRVRFREGETLRSGRGDAGALIPPVDHHVLGNGREEPSVTLHVYGGEMGECAIFHPEGETGSGWYRMEEKALELTTERPLVG